MEQCLKIVKILNNNAVVCVDSDNEEKIIMGRGIAFQQKTGSIVDNEKIEKIFSLNNPETSSHFQQVIKEIPVEHILLAEKIISHAKKICSKELNDSIYITLSDHISTAIMRVKQNIIIKDPLLPSIKRLYSDEYNLAKDALKIIKEDTGIDFPEDEAGFITMHFINSELGPNNKNINKIVTTAEKIASIVTKYIEKDINEESISWQRFTTHISFLVQRLLQGYNYEESSDNQLFDMLKTSYPSAFECSIEIKNFLDSEFKCIIGSEELSYLMIHISRLQKEYGVHILNK